MRNLSICNCWPTTSWRVGGIGEGMGMQLAKDGRRIVYTVDRHIGGLYTLELNI